MTIDVIGIGAAPGDNTGDGLRTAMAKVNNNFGSSANAASKLVGTATGEVPTADDLDMVGASENYTSNNTNPNLFGGAANQIVQKVLFRNGTEARAILTHSIPGVGYSIIKGSGSYKITDTVFNNITTGIPASSISLVGIGQKVAQINIGGLSGLVQDKIYYLISESGNSTIEVVA